jgi:hypothetical protein
MAKGKKQNKKEPFKGRVLNARPDVIDFRDKLYTASLFEVPVAKDLEEYKKHKVPILDQGQEGACAGFGLATVIHYLLLTRKHVPCKDRVSPRMLYEMAKKYDEWEGEDYIGSTARGAMKGWHKHGVCKEEIWKYDAKKPDKEFTSERAENAANFPVGAYYRVNHKDLADLHTAIAEVGILYATARVHDGWFKVGKDGEIPYSGQEIQGGHAFAIVAYNENGFWIQNSWGDEWGLDGFALISYDDWLANGTDVWVARLGSPVALRSANSIAKTFSVAAATRDGFSFKDLRPHVISFTNNGELKTTGTYGNTSKDIERIFTEYIPAVTANWKRKRILFYAHGGLVSEDSVLQRLADYRQAMLSNEVYPIFFVWNSDLWNTIKNLLKDGLAKRKPEERVSSAFDFMLDRLDDALEPLLRFPGKAAWNEMKENAIAASGRGGGAVTALNYLKKYMDENPKAGIHLVGHSAGANFLAPVIDQLVNRHDLKIRSCTLWAPSCTMEVLEESYLPAIKKNAIGKFALYTLTDQAEQDDNCFNIYNKSLLYLVSNSFEITPRGTSLMGMAKFIKEHEELSHLIQTQKVDWITSPNTLPSPDCCEARHHGDFDNDVPCLESTLARILSADPGLKRGDAAKVSDKPESGGEAGLRAGAVPEGGEEKETVPLGPSPVEAQLKMRPTKSDYRVKRNEINKGFSLDN